MANQMMNASKLEELPAEARERIETLRLLFIERSRGHLEQIQELLALRKLPGERGAADADLMTLAHSLVGTAGIFGFQALGEAAFRFENTVREEGYSEAEFASAMADLLDQIKAME
ncbi:Hpt domain-containing protein [uncultured Hoeflea sp.]|uniref:Hpt domain-containing protein n=1 Tax=uncultured Hoeflea sp. TaxID=538666 RepID=UPI0030EF8E89|tara:strand:+ start:70240 stop:70587 length:348 start_codon:yes stop_codon:yes gene_type:complete